jgi:hypothetical protein
LPGPICPEEQRRYPVAETDAEVQLSPLVASVISASLKMTHDVTGRLVDSLTEQVAVAHAREAAVEWGVCALLDGPYMPTPAAIVRALYPDADLIERFRDDKQAS